MPVDPWLHLICFAGWAVQLLVFGKVRDSGIGGVFGENIKLLPMSHFLFTLFINVYPCDKTPRIHFLLAFSQYHKSIRSVESLRTRMAERGAVHHGVNAST
jgi:hypothetical protein